MELSPTETRCEARLCVPATISCSEDGLQIEVCNESGSVKSVVLEGAMSLNAVEEELRWLINCVTLGAAKGLARKDHTTSSGVNSIAPFMTCHHMV